MSNKSPKNLSENVYLNDIQSDLQNQSCNESLNKRFYGYNESDPEKVDESTIESVEISSKSNSVKEIQILKSRIFKNVYCEKCLKVCSVLILDNGSLTIDCDCSREININAVKFKEQYLHGDEKTNDILKDLKKDLFNFNLLSSCPLHPKEKFIYYCIDCGKDICKKCMEKDAYYSNTEKKNKFCENHTLINLNENKETIENIKKLKKYIENNKISDEKDKKIFDDLFTIIECFVENYELYTCYNLMISLENFKNFLENIYNCEDDIYKLKKSEGSYAHLIKINSEKEMKEKIKFAKQIYSIIIKETDKNIDLSILKIMNFLI